MDHVIRKRPALTPWTVPALIVLYFAIQFTVRLLLSGNLEYDEAELPDHSYWALGYPNSNPPFFDWCVLGIYKLTGHWPFSIALPKYAAFAAFVLLIHDAGRRAGGGLLAGALAAASVALIGQYVWQSQITLTHSVMATAWSAAILHGLVLLLERRTLARYLWLGVAIACGTLSKYNQVLLVASLAAAMLTTREGRAILFDRRILAAGAIAALIAAPHLVWLTENLKIGTSRVVRLMAKNEHYDGLDVPGLGINGLLSVVRNMVALCGPLLIVFGLVRWLTPASPDPVDPRPAIADPARRIFGRSILIGMVAAMIGALAFDLSNVLIRYLSPLSVPLPLWAALAFLGPGRARAARIYVGLGAAAAVVAALAYPMPTLLRDHRYGYPFAEMAAEIEAKLPPPYTIVAARDDDTVNWALKMPAATMFRPQAQPDRILLIWVDKEGDRGRALLKAGTGNPNPWREVSPAFTFQRQHYFFSGAQARIHAQILERDPAPKPALDPAARP